MKQPIFSFVYSEQNHFRPEIFVVLFKILQAGRYNFSCCLVDSIDFLLKIKQKRVIRPCMVAYGYPWCV